MRKKVLIREKGQNNQWTLSHTKARFLSSEGFSNCFSFPRSCPCVGLSGYYNTSGAQSSNIMHCILYNRYMLATFHILFIKPTELWSLSSAMTALFVSAVWRKPDVCRAPVAASKGGYWLMHHTTVHFLFNILKSVIISCLLVKPVTSGDREHYSFEM